jgi:hypothetical protein
MVGSRRENGVSQGGSGGFYEAFDRQKLNTFDPDDFKSRMLDFCRANQVAADALIAGNIQLLGLEAMREQFGSRWGKARDQVHQLTETMIKSILTPNDVFVQTGDDNFIILFGRATLEQADVQVKQISTEMNRRMKSIGSAGAMITARALVLDVPRDDTSALSTPAGLTGSVETAHQELEARDRKIFEQAQDELETRFWPIANVTKRLVSMYLVRLEGPAGPLLADRSETGALEAMRDIRILREGSETLNQDGLGRAFMVVPVDFITISDKRYRVDYLKQCHDLYGAAAKRMILMIEGLPDDVSPAKLHNTLSYVGPFFAGFIAEFGMDFDGGERLDINKLIAVAVSGTSFEEATPAVTMGLSGFKKRNGARKSRTIFTNAPNPKIASAARRARFDYVQGVGVAPAFQKFGRTFTIS